MGWGYGFDSKWQRDIGYGVPAFCDHPGCEKEIDRGLYYVCCGQQPYGGEHGCGLYFCDDHQFFFENEEDEEDERNGVTMCERCLGGQEPFEPSGDTAEWIVHKLTDPSWEAWRTDNPDEVKYLSQMVV